MLGDLLQWNFPSKQPPLSNIPNIFFHCSITIAFANWEAFLLLSNWPKECLQVVQSHESAFKHVPVGSLGRILEALFSRMEALKN